MWKVETIDGVTYLNVGTTLYEVMALTPADRLSADDLRLLSEKRTHHPKYNVDLVPYRDCETKRVVEPGMEHVHHARECVTLAIAHIAAGQRWQAFVPFGDRPRPTMAKASSAYEQADSDVSDSDESDDESARAARVPMQRSATEAESASSFAQGYGRASGVPKGVPVVTIGRGLEGDEEDDDKEDDDMKPSSVACRRLLATTDADNTNNDADDGSSSSDEVYGGDMNVDDLSESKATVFEPINVRVDAETGRIVQRLDNNLTGLTAKEAEAAQKRREQKDAQEREQRAQSGQPSIVQNRRTVDQLRDEQKRLLVEQEKARRMHEAGFPQRPSAPGEQAKSPFAAGVPVLAAPTTASASGAPNNGKQAGTNVFAREVSQFGLPPDMLRQALGTSASGGDGEAEYPKSVDEILHLARPFVPAAKKAPTTAAASAAPSAPAAPTAKPVTTPSAPTAQSQAACVAAQPAPAAVHTAISRHLRAVAALLVETAALHESVIGSAPR